MENQFEELLTQILLFLDEPTLSKALALDKTWQQLHNKKTTNKLASLWVKAYLKHGIFNQPAKKAKVVHKTTTQPKVNLIKPTPTQSATQILLEKHSLEAPYSALKLIFNHANKKDLPMVLLACAIAPTATFIMAEALTHDFEASLFATLMMFGIGMPAVLLGGFHFCKYIQDMSLDLMTMLIGKMRKNKRRKIINALLNDDDNYDEENLDDDTDLIDTNKFIPLLIPIKTGNKASCA